jgi:crossover junction endodeoxyribonuclease RuvC
VAVLRILGIDPGTQVVGYGCLELAVSGAVGGAHDAPLAMRGSNVIRPGGDGSVRLVGAGVLRLGGRDTALPARLLELARQLRSLLAAWAPGELALEHAFHGKSAQAALRIGEARGVVLAEAAAAGLAIHQFAPARVKRCVTGNGAAGKAAVGSMILHLLQGAGAASVAALPADATDALAIAWTRLEARRSPLLAAAEGRSPPAAGRGKRHGKGVAGCFPPVPAV